MRPRMRAGEIGDVERGHHGGGANRNATEHPVEDKFRQVARQGGAHGGYEEKTAAISSTFLRPIRIAHGAGTRSAYDASD